MQNIQEAFHIAWNDLLANSIRSVLSILGIVIGIASVITILSVGEGARQQILNSINSMGMNVYYIQASYDETTSRMGMLDQNDVETLEKLPFVTTAFPQLNMYQVLRSRSAEAHGFVNAVRASYITSQNLLLLKGRNFSPIEFEDRALVCLIGDTTANYFFQDSDPIGATLFVNKIPWTIIGVYTRNINGQKLPDYLNKNFEVLAPMPTLIRNAPDINIQTVEVHVRDNATSDIESQLVAAVEHGDPQRKGLYRAQDVKKYYESSLAIQKTFSIIGAIVASISLIVGGIGMMNVMLTSVAERTREIGIRRAVGARRRDILFQFLVESCVLSGTGGFLGLVLGAAISHMLPVLFKQTVPIAPQLHPSFLVLSVAIGVIIGMAFGFYPAVKASKLSPAEALRTE